MELVILPLVAKISVIVKSKDIFSCLVALDCRCAQAFATHFLNWKNIKCLFGVQDDLMVKDTLMAPTTPSKVKDRGCYRNLPLISRSDMYGDHHSDVTSETTSFNFHVASYTPVNAGAVDFFNLSKDGFYHAGEDNVPGPMKSIMPKTDDYPSKIPNFIIPWFDGEECFTESNGKMTPMADDNPEVTATCTMECSNDVENPFELARVFPGERAQPVGKRKEIREFPFANKMANKCRLGTPIVDSRQ